MHWRLFRYVWNTDHFPCGIHVVGTDVLNVAGESLVQPQVVPPFHRHQIPEPLQLTEQKARRAWFRATAAPSEQPRMNLWW